MRPTRSRFLRRAAWLPIVGCSFVLMTWAFSIFGWVYYVGERRVIGITAGRLDWVERSGSGEIIKVAPHSATPMTHPLFLIRPDHEIDPIDKDTSVNGLIFGGHRIRLSAWDRLGLAMPQTKRDQVVVYRGSTQSNSMPVTYTTFIVPLWPVFIVALIVLVRLNWLNRPYPAGCCRSCGYNLNAIESAKCPECGMEIPEEQRARLTPPRIVTPKNSTTRTG